MKKIAVFMLFGQSNAVGHAMPMDEKDYILEPLKNVYGLNRDPNQSYDIKELKFTGYTSFGMNLAETQDNTYSVANCLARRWQDEIDNGNPNGLPDLYIIHIAIGSQGLLDMWNMNREKVMVPGILGTVDISMYPLAKLVLNLFNKYCKDNDLEPDFVGMHWRGGEQEVRRGIDYLEKINLNHEAGHAILAYAMPTCDPVQQISIIPSGRALGYTLNPPTEDQFSVYKQEMREEIAMLLAGRAAEKIIFGDVSGGASNDIERATAIARKMVTQLGMSDNLGPIAFGTNQGEVFLGRSISGTPEYSAQTAAVIDEEVHKIITEAYENAKPPY